MSERDSNPASDDSDNPTPQPYRKTGNSGEPTHSYFIPLVMLIVLGIIIVSTFYSKEFNHLIAGATLSDQADEHASAATENALASSKAIDDSEDNATSKPKTETAPVTMVLHKVATAVLETTVPDATLAKADTASSVTSAKQALAPELNSRASTRDEASYPDRKNHDPYPYAPSMSYGMPRQYHSSYNEMMEQRRRSHEEARQARKEHRIKMHEYRAAVLKRIKQDRLDMYKRGQDTEHAYQRRLDEQMNWTELQDKRAMNRPI